MPDKEEIASNILWSDALLRHQIFILRAAGTIRTEIIELLNQTEQDIAMRIRDALDLDPRKLTQRLRRAQDLIKQIKWIRSKAWDDVDEKWLNSMLELMKEETSFLKNTLELVVPVQLTAKLPPVSALKNLLNTRPFEGRLLKEWAKDIRRADLRRIEDQIKIGIIQGESSKVIARRVVGTARLKGTDGVTQITRHNAASITRTATIHFSNAARGEFLAENAEFFTEELFVATLDSRTTPVCRGEDGKRYPVGVGPQPPLHWSCRSLRVALIGEEAIGMRPAKPVTQQMLLREFSKQNNLGDITKRSNLPRGYKGKFDSFSQRRVREMVGQVPAKTTYGQWLGKQSAEFQNDVLGTTKAKLFRKGGLTLDRFVDKTGRELSLKDLAQVEAKAFRAAGLDPKNFLPD